MPIIKYGDHNIEVRFEIGGAQTVLYDGEAVSSRMPDTAQFTPFASGMTHSFSVEEGGDTVVYDVQVKPRGLLGKLGGIGVLPRVEVFRNGKKIYSS